MSDAATPSYERPTTSTRDYDDLRSRLEHWLAARMTDAAIERFVLPQGNGMSSETVVFDASHLVGGQRMVEHFVLRMPPASDSVPVFPTYDLAKQAYAMQLVGRTTSAPVPMVPFHEADPAALGAEFLIMQRINGQVPADVMPYTFGDNWLFDATDEQRVALQERTVEALAAIHSAPTDEESMAPLQLPATGDTALRRHYNDARAYYDWVVADGMRSPLLEECFAWLAANWPSAAEGGGDVLSWGDSRIGNIMYGEPDGFTPVAILDWEMVAVGPREIDLGWLCYFAQYFQDLATTFGMPGLDHFMPRAELVSWYSAVTGHSVQDLDWFLFYAAVRYGVIYFRIGRRQVLFGEVPEPAHPDDLIIHASTLRDWLASH